MVGAFCTDEHSRFRINHQFLAGLKVCETRIFDLINASIVVLEASLALVKVPKFFLRIFSEVKLRVFEIFVIH